MEAGAEILTCTQSRGAIASLLDWLSKQPESEAQQTAKRKAEDLIQNPYLTYDAAHALIFKTTRDLGSKTYFIEAKEMEDDQRMVELDSIFFHISTYTRNLNPTGTSSDR